MRSILLVMLVSGLLSCASTGERGVAAGPLPDGRGRICVAGPAPLLFMQAKAVDDSILRPIQTGEHTCMAIAPGRTFVVVHERGELIETWVDAGETTTIELGPTPQVTATAAETEALARVFVHGRCAFSRSSCSAEQLADALAQLELARASTSVRERQVARLLAWSLLDEDDHEARAPLAAEIWGELASVPLVAASFSQSLAAVADQLGPEARRELERFATEASDIGRGWSPYMRHRVLLSLMQTAGEGAESDALRARVRAVTSTDPELRESPLRTIVIEAAGFDPQLIAQGEAIARDVIAPFVDDPCENGSRWLLYVHSPACPACKPAVQQLGALLDQGDAQLHVVTVSVEGDAPPLTERPQVEATELPKRLGAWFDEARGGVVTPYFFGLACDAARLRLVGFGSLTDATVWDARAVSSE